jgi:ABC-type Fe3+/spermidine/putrescine transport system ATPase subunit
MGRRERTLLAIKMLDSFGLGPFINKRIGTLSAGQKQRVGLARALVLSPPIVLFDEPLAALDANLRLQMQEELKRLQSQFQSGFLFVTHDQKEAFSLSDRIVVMEQGRIAQVGSPEEIYLQPANAFVAAFTGRYNLIPYKGLRRVRDEWILEISGGLLRAPVRSAQLGEHGVVAVRHESISLVSTSELEPTQNILPSILRWKEFSGPTCILHLGLDDGTLIKVELPQDRLPHIPQRGERLHLTWRVADTFAFETDLELP